jgi:Putative auto-transporter adhesin, head GIN domain
VNKQLMKKALIALSVLGVLFSGCLQINWSGTATIRGSGNLVSENRTVSQFDRVLVSGSGQVSIVQDDQEALTIDADDNLLPLINSDVAGGVLRLGPQNVNLVPSRNIHYKLHLKNLTELHLSGSLEAEARSLKSDHLQLSISGSGKIQVPRLEASELDVHISGSGDTILAGSVQRQHIQISGSGNYQAGDCESQSTSIHISGSADATIWARTGLEAHVSGSGDIKYYGSPQVSSHVSGSGGVHALGNK